MKAVFGDLRVMFNVLSHTNVVSTFVKLWSGRVVIKEWLINHWHKFQKPINRLSLLTCFGAGHSATALMLVGVLPKYFQQPLLHKFVYNFTKKVVEIFWNTCLVIFEVWGLIFTLYNPRPTDVWIRRMLGWRKPVSFSNFILWVETYWLRTCSSGPCKYHNL